MKKLFIALLMGMFMLTLVSAVGDIGIVKQGDCIDLYNYCPTCSYINLTAISHPNATIETMNLNMTKTGNNYVYNYCSTSVKGEYSYTTCGDKNAPAEVCEDISFEISPTGEALSQPSSILYIVLFVVLFGLIGLTIGGVSLLPPSNAKDEQGRIIQISYLKYLRPVLWFMTWLFIVAILFISSNLAFAYLETSLVANFLFILFRIAFGLTLPIVVVWVVWLFARIFDDKQIRNLWERGMFPEGAKF